MFLDLLKVFCTVQNFYEFKFITIKITAVWFNCLRPKIFKQTVQREKDRLSIRIMNELAKKDDELQSHCRQHGAPIHASQMKMFREREGTFIEYGTSWQHSSYLITENRYSVANFHVQKEGKAPSGAQREQINYSVQFAHRSWRNCFRLHCYVTVMVVILYSINVQTTYKNNCEI